MSRTKKAIHNEIDDHIANCGMCWRWFNDDEDFHGPCSVLVDLHDEHDGKKEDDQR